MKKDRARQDGAGTETAQPPLFVFVHIPKTAGTALAAVFAMNEPGERMRGLSNVFKGSGGLSTALMERLRTDTEPLNLEAVRIVTGHFPIGIGEHLQKHAPGRELRFLTCMREPVDRTLSHYYQIRARPTEPGKYTLSGLPSEPTLADMLERGFTHDNVQTRMLSGLFEPFGEVTEAMLEGAKRNLRESLVFFGLTERFDESLVLARRRLGLPAILSGLDATAPSRSLRRASGRVNTTRPRGADVPQALREEAEACNRYDIKLYRYAKKLFDSAPERQEFDFQVELAALSAARGAGEVEVTTDPPSRFTGSAEEWRMLVTDRATILRYDVEFAKLRAFTDDLRKRTKGNLALLERISREQAALEKQHEGALKRERETARFAKAAVRAKAAKREHGTRDQKRSAPASRTAGGDRE